MKNDEGRQVDKMEGYKVAKVPNGMKMKLTPCMGVIMVPCILYFAGLKDAVLSAFGL